MQSKATSQQARDRRKSGRGQLSLVEHALCPLDARVSMKPNLTHFSEYHFFDRHGNRKSATARVDCPNGLSANDEFYLWGLLALTFADDEPGIEFRATPHFCLKQLGRDTKPGGKEHRLFREALKRLAAVTRPCRLCLSTILLAERGEFFFRLRTLEKNSPRSVRRKKGMEVERSSITSKKLRMNDGGSRSDICKQSDSFAGTRLRLSGWKRRDRI